MNGTYSPGKIDYNKSGRKNCQVTLEWELTDNKCFSMSGNIWNPRHTDIYSGGQNVDEIAKYFPDDNKVREMLVIWQRWHLNDLKAGCEHQRAMGWDKKKIDETKETGWHIDTKTANLAQWLSYKDNHEVGLLLKPCPVCGYKYGSAWLKEELPQEVIDTVKSW